MHVLTKLRQFWRSRSAGRTRSGPGQRTHCLALWLEQLEGRLVLSDGTGAGTHLVKDINPGSAASNIFAPVDLGGVLVFAANDGTNGSELWKSDGTVAGTVLLKDINPGSAGSYPGYRGDLAKVNGTLFFAADDGTNGPGAFDLWKTDGTTAGTVLVKDIGVEDYMTNVNGTLFFFGSDGTASGSGLWKSDGTTAGTVLVKAVPVSSALVNVNGTAFFTSFGGSSDELWKSDGTPGGTVLVQGGISATSLTNVNGTLFFSADDGTHGRELWKSDGTAAGTVLVKDIYPGTTTTMSKSCGYFGGHCKNVKTTTINSSDPAWLTNINGTLYFTANDGTDGDELWKSDGTALGTVLVKDIRQSKSGSYPHDLTNVNGTLFFGANDGKNGDELWKSDGTAAGTVMVKDINPGSSSSDPQNLTDGNGTLYFTAIDGTDGDELWKSDGTAAGTVLVKDINPGSTGSYPTLLTVSGGHLFFTADDGVHGRELWDPPLQSTTASYQQINLVGYQAGLAPHTDPNLNGWGMDFAPGGPFCVANNATGVATFYDRSGQVLPQVVTIPTAAVEPSGPHGPTGVVYNPTSDFVISEDGRSAPAEFLFCARDGTVSGWNPAVDPDKAILLVDNSTEAPSRADYTGLVIAQNGLGQNVLCVADFHNNKIDRFDGSFHSLGSFSDPVVPAQYPVHTAWQVEEVGGRLWVTYASHKPGPYGGVVDIFDTDGHLLTPNHFAANAPGAGPLESPWGIVQAPADFGAFSNDILIGNVEGDGNINAFDPATGAFLGQLTHPDGTPIAIPGLWDLTFGGNSPSNGLSKQLYFDAGPNVPNPAGNGLFGRILAAGNPDRAAALRSVSSGMAGSPEAPGLSSQSIGGPSPSVPSQPLTSPAEPQAGGPVPVNSVDLGVAWTDLTRRDALDCAFGELANRQ